MQIIENIAEMSEIGNLLIKSDISHGFVPTMGALHEGHLSLVKGAVNENQKTTVSIFVNPLQFAPTEDFDKYPRSFDRDKGLCEENGVDYLFCPNYKEIYPEQMLTYVVPEKEIELKLCGLKREGHFRGVLTVVNKLFNIVKPNIAYFGQKDYQQQLLIKAMVRDLNMPIKIKTMDIIREPDGLAMSSRNQYLTEDVRIKAKAIYQALLHGQTRINAGESSVSTLITEMNELLIEADKIDYINIVDSKTLQDLIMAEPPLLIAIAAYFGGVRLIDNLLMLKT